MPGFLAGTCMPELSTCQSAHCDPPSASLFPSCLAGCAARLPQLFGELPPRLRLKLAAQQLRPVLKELHFFPASMASKQIAACCLLLAGFAQPLSLNPGQSLEAAPAAGGGTNGGSGSVCGSDDGSSGESLHAPTGSLYILCTGEILLLCFLVCDQARLAEPACISLYVRVWCCTGTPMRSPGALPALPAMLCRALGSGYSCQQWQQLRRAAAQPCSPGLNRPACSSGRPASCRPEHPKPARVAARSSGSHTLSPMAPGQRPAVCSA